MSDASVIDQISSLGVVPVVVIDDPGSAAPLAASLRDGGLPCAEVTFRTAAAAEALREMSQEPDFLLGAGTVTSVAQVEEALTAGARFIVTPGFSQAVARECIVLGVPVIPGVATATEIQMAIDAGLSTVKFFPAELAGGPAAIKALSAPFRHISFVPTGGVGVRNLGDYFALPSVVAVGGSWMVPASALNDHDWGRVTGLAAQAIDMVQMARRMVV